MIRCLYQSVSGNQQQQRSWMMQLLPRHQRRIILPRNNNNVSILASTATTRSHHVVVTSTTSQPHQQHQYSACYFSTSTSTASLSSSSSPSSSSSSEIPFYGLPRSSSSSSNSSIGKNLAPSRIGLLLKNTVTAMRDPTRADAVAAVGELTGTLALQRLYDAMSNDKNGLIILRDRPVVCKATIPYERLIEEAQHIIDNDDDETYNPETITFGQAYGKYLSTHGFDPDERDKVKYISDPDLAYVMLRYRQCHDFWHALTDLPPTVAGELGLKWLELFQTGLPLAAFSSTLGSMGLLSYHEQHVVFNMYLPWACRVARQIPFGTLMMVSYEKEFDTPVMELRQRLGIEPAPQLVEGH